MDFKKGNIEGIVVNHVSKHVDERGYLLETFREDTLPAGIKPAMSYISYTEPGIGRGPHEHAGQTDIFAFIGPGNFKIYLWDNRKDSSTYLNRMVVFGGADSPLIVIVPPGIVHGYKNISVIEKGMVLNYPDTLYAGWDKKEVVDEIRHEDQQDVYFQDFIA